MHKCSKVLLVEDTIIGMETVPILCLPHNPDPATTDFSTLQNDDRASSSFIYGPEYQFTYRNIAVYGDVPCKVCDVTHVS